MATQTVARASLRAPLSRPISHGTAEVALSKPVYSALSPLGERVLLPIAPGSINGKLLAHYRRQLDDRRMTLGEQHPRTLAAEAQLRGWAMLTIESGVSHG